MKILKNFALSIVSGILLALAFPRFDLFYLAFFAFIPIVYVLNSSDFKKTLLYGFLFGFSFWSVSLYWMYPFIKFNIGTMQSVAISFLFWCYLSLFFVIWAVMLNFVNKKAKPITISLFAAFLWVVLEFARAYLSTGFAWNFVGYSQAKFNYFIQVADILGVSGISFFVVFINMLLYFWLKNIKNIKDIKYLLIALIVFAIIMGYGYKKISYFSTDYGDEILIGVVQPNVDQYKKWNKKYVEEFYSSINNDLKFFNKKRLSLVVYPETFITEYYKKDKKTEKFIKHISSLGKLSLMGSISYDGNLVYNSVLAFKKNGECVSTHNKNHLVVFGEYIPFRDILEKYIDMFNAMGDFTKGNKMDVVECENVKVGPTICSENFFPELSRSLVVKGAKILTNHTNDGWFLDTAAPYQHFTMNIFRAIENRKNVIVCANTGLSAVINCRGDVVKQTSLNKKTLFTSYVYQNNIVTFYDKYGYLFIQLSALLMVLLLLIMLV